MPSPISEISQPRGDIKCSIYGPICAFAVTTGKRPDVGGTVARIPYRLGGNSDAAFTILCGYGLTLGSSYKGKWRNILQNAMANGHPVALGVSWTKGSKSGNHWVYYTGDLTARDQQNGHLLITINENGWTATAPGGWRYQITQIGIGCPNRDAARGYL